VQEGLTNVLKHAQSRRVSLILQRTSDQVLVILEDDGRGFDADAVTKSSAPSRRLGLLGMKERVALVGGTLTIESTPGGGTTIFARIPLPADGEEHSDG
jgi:signal transduction histidine kinase